MPLNNFGIVNLSVMRSAQPDELGFADLAKFNVRAIVKLNSEDCGEVAACNKYGIDLYLFPIPTFLNSVDSIITIANYIKSLEKLGKLLVHCTHGRDRTGLVIGAYRILFDGMSVADANAERKAYGVEGIIKLADMDMDLILYEIAKQELSPPGA